MSGPPSTPSPVGQLIAGRYQIVAAIGHGGHGLVYRARDQRLQTEVAVKMLSDVAAGDPALVERLLREQKALSELSGTYAVQVLDLCTTASGRLCLVMELLDGIDFDRRLAELESTGLRLGVEELVRVLDPVVDTLERAHAVGIVHRDLKPANVFLLSAGGVRLLDFGLARLRRESPLTRTGTIVGSPSYIAPEAWQGKSSAVDARADVYGLGVLIYRALSSRIPFAGETLRDKFVAATSAPRPSLVALRPDLPVAVDDWVLRALAIDPNERYPSVRDAWNALLAALQPPRPSAAERPLDVDEFDPELRPRPNARATTLEEAAEGAADGLKRAWRATTAAVRRLLQRDDAEANPFTAAEDPDAMFNQRGVPGPMPERSVVSEWLAKSDFKVDRSMDPIRPARVVRVGESASSPREPLPTMAETPDARGGSTAEEDAGQPESGARRTTRKKSSQRKTATKKTATKKTATKKTATKKTAAKKTAAKKTAAKKTAAKKTRTRKAAAKPTATRKTAAKSKKTTTTRSNAVTKAATKRPRRSKLS